MTTTSSTTPHRLSGVVHRLESGLPDDQSPWQKRAFLTTLVLAVIFGVIAALLIAQYIYVGRTTLEHARVDARASAVRQAKIIDDRLKAIEPIAAAISRDLSAGTLRVADIPARLRDGLAANGDIFELGVVYVPFGKDAATKLYAPDAARTSSGIEVFQLESRYDYTALPWYTGGIAANKPVWGDPYLGRATNTLVVGYTVPIYKSGDTAHPVGVVRANLSMDGIRRIVSSLSLGQTGYGFLLSRKGVYMSHPDESLVREQKSIIDMAKQRHDLPRQQLGELALQGKPAEANSVSSITGQATWMFAEPIPSAQWTLGATFIRDEFLPEPKDIRRSLARIACALMAFVFFCAIIWFRGWTGGPNILWNVSITQTILCVIGIAFMWWLTLTFPDHNGETAVHIADQSGLQKFLETRALSRPQHTLPPQIPTGLYVRTLRFGAGNDVLVTGTIWQKYPIDSALKVTQGFQFVDAETMEASESYRVRQGDNEVVGWTFKATIREQFEGAIKYPFDRALIRLRIAPKDVNENIILTPDLYSYQLLTPGVLPGVARSIVLPGWDLDRGYFNYSPAAYNTSFGLQTLAGQDRSYELGYTIVAVRRFLDPFISSVLPMLVVSCLLFGLLLIGSRESAKIAATGFKTSDVLRAGITLLFPVLIAQVNLRSKIGSNTIIYIEYFYFVLYAAILGVAANALSFTLGRYNIVHVRDNLLPKLLYWPLVVGACFGVTLIFLY